MRVLQKEQRVEKLPILNAGMHSQQTQQNVTLKHEHRLESTQHWMVKVAISVSVNVEQCPKTIVHHAELPTGTNAAQLVVQINHLDANFHIVNQLTTEVSCKAVQ